MKNNLEEQDESLMNKMLELVCSCSDDLLQLDESFRNNEAISLLFRTQKQLLSEAIKNHSWEPLYTVETS